MARVRPAMIAWLSLLWLVSCQTTYDANNNPALARGGLTLIDGRLVFRSQTMRVPLTPTVRLDDAWFSADKCRESAVHLFLCPLPARGEFLIVVGPHAGQFTVKFRAAIGVTLSAIGMRGETTLAGEHYMLSNGFQSWSDSGWIKVPSKPDDAAIVRALTDKEGDEARDGTVVSNEYAALSNRNEHLFIGATSADMMRPWVQFGADGDQQVMIKAISGFAGEKIILQPDNVVSGESWMIAAGSDLPAIMKDYAGRLVSFGRQPGASEIPPKVGWNSWYNLWWDATEAQLRPNIPLTKDLVARKFGAQGLKVPPITVLIDDGWEKMWGEWTSGPRFPSGVGRLAAIMKEQGVEPGIWIAPFLVNLKSTLIKSKPHWFIKNHIFHHPSGNYMVLDVTHPEVAAHLTQIMQSLVQAGYKKIKIDFLMTEAVEGERYRPVTALQAYHIGLKILRRAVGDEIYLLGCGGPAVASFPYINSWRVGPDIAMGEARKIGPSWTDVATQTRNISARWFLCNVTHCDADPLLMRSPHTRESALAAGWVVAVAGGGLYFSDDLRELPEERKTWPLPRELIESALGGQAAVPEPIVPHHVPDALPAVTAAKRLSFSNDIFPNASWRLPDGNLLVINFGEEPISFEGVTIAKHASYIKSTK